MMVDVSAEESFDFSQQSTFGFKKSSHLRRQTSLGVLPSSSQQQRFLKFPVHRRSYNFRNGSTDNRSSVITPPDSPIMDNQSEDNTPNTTAETTPEMLQKEIVLDYGTTSTTSSDPSSILSSQASSSTSLSSQVSTISSTPVSLRPLSLRPLSVRPLSILQEDDNLIKGSGLQLEQNSDGTPAGIVVDNKNDTDVDDEYEDNQKSSAASSISVDFPFLRAIHAFEASSLSGGGASSDPDPSTICLSFEESEIALLHSVHTSGWGDATLLSTGQRGWIPTNYFAPYAETKVIPLLSAILNFVISPKSYPLRMHPQNDNDNQYPIFTFSQASITNIITGVRSLLEACGTLTRDTQVVRRSQSIRKFRKSLLTELAILVSLAKQYRNTVDDIIIDKLVVVCYKIVTKAVMFLDVWTVDVNLNEEERDNRSSMTTISSNIASAFASTYGNTATTITANTTITNSTASPTKRKHHSNTENRVSVIFHSQPPFANRRLDEVNEALTSYLGIFIHRMTMLQSDPTAATQILVNTRKSMLACRELLATVEAISSKSLPRNRDLENSKDKLFIRIRTLVTSAREVVGDGSSESKTLSTENLIQNATECAQSACECVVRSRNILAKIGDFQLASGREYPDFSDGIIAVVGPGRRSESPASAISSSPQKSMSILPDIPVLSPIISNDSLLQRQSRSVHSRQSQYDKLDVIQDDNGKLRVTSLKSLIILLTDELTEQDPFLVSTFFLTFRLFTTPKEVIQMVIQRYEVDTNENTLSLQRLQDLSSRRVKIFNFIKRWMESHWQQSTDAVVLNDILLLSDCHFKTILPNANLIITDLAAKLSFGHLHDGEPILPRQITLPQVSAPIAIGAINGPNTNRSLPRHQVNLLNKVNEVNGFHEDELIPVNNHDDDLKSVLSTSTWTSSLRMRHSLAGAGSLVNYHMNGSVVNNNGTHIVTILDFDPVDISNQLAIMDSLLFCQIQPEELLNQNFTKKKRDLGLSPNVSRMTAFSNQLSAFVGDSILGGDIPAKTRRNLLKQWIKIADKCYDVRNFNSLLSIVSALQSVNIMRLKRIWDLLPPKYHAVFQDLKKFLIPDKNFAYYRSKLKDQSPPCIPYLGIYLSDLIFIEEGNPKTRELPSGSQGINLDRFERLTKLIGGIQQFQIPYRMSTSRELQTWLRGEMRKSHQAVSRDLNGLWRRSCLVEPKNA